MAYILYNEIDKVEFMECLLRRNRPMELFVSRYIDCLQLSKDKEDNSLQCFEDYIMKHTIEGEMIIDLAKSIAYNNNIKYLSTNKYGNYLKQIIDKNKQENSTILRLFE